MRVIVIPFLILFVSTSIAQTKVGTVDIEFIVSKMPELTTVKEELKKYGEGLDLTLQDKMKTYQDKINSYNEQLETLSEKEVQEQQTVIFNLENEIAQFSQNGIQLMRIREDELKRPLYQKIAGALEKIANAGNYTQVLSSDGDTNLIFFDPKYDLTLAILTELGIRID